MVAVNVVVGLNLVLEGDFNGFFHVKVRYLVREGVWVAIERDEVGVRVPVSDPVWLKLMEPVFTVTVFVGSLVGVTNL